MSTAPRKLIDYTQRGKIMPPGKSKQRRSSSSLSSIGPLCLEQKGQRRCILTAPADSSVPKILSLSLSELSFHKSIPSLNEDLVIYGSTSLREAWKDQLNRTSDGLHERFFRRTSATPKKIGFLESILNSLPSK